MKDEGHEGVVREMMFCRFEWWNMHIFDGANWWRWSFSAKWWWKVGFSAPKNLKVPWIFGQKWKYSRNGSTKIIFEVWLVESIQFFSANFTVLMVFGQTLLNGELWRSPILIKITYFLHLLTAILYYVYVWIPWCGFAAPRKLEDIEAALQGGLSRGCESLVRQYITHVQY